MLTKLNCPRGQRGAPDELPRDTVRTKAVVVNPSPKKKKNSPKKKKKKTFKKIVETASASFGVIKTFIEILQLLL